MDDYIIGTPDIQAGSWELQMQPDNCAVVAEMSLINQFGYGLNQEQACYISSSLVSAGSRHISRRYWEHDGHV